MTMDLNALRNLLCLRLCEEVRIEVRHDGALMLQTRFQFPDGDRFPIHLVETPGGGFRLSDLGHTLMRISYEDAADSFLKGSRKTLLERIMSESGLQWDGGAFCVDTSPERLSEALFRFGQGLTRVYDLTLLPCPGADSAFYDDLADLLSGLVGEEKFQPDYRPNVPNAEAYPVDYRIEGRNGVPLFLFGVPDRDKARLTTITLSHFHRHALAFDSILVFENQTEIPRADLARLSDVGGNMVSSLEAREDLERDLLRRVST